MHSNADDGRRGRVRNILKGIFIAVAVRFVTNLKLNNKISQYVLHNRTNLLKYLRNVIATTKF